MKYDFTNTETGEIIWQGKTAQDVIDRTMHYNDCLITRKTEIGDNQFYKQTIYSTNSTNPKPAIPRKVNLPVNKYGGYSGENAAHFMVIRYSKKDALVNEIISIPAQVYTLEKTKPGSINEYLHNNYKQATVLLSKIPINQKIEYDGNEQFIVGSKEVANAKQLKLPYGIEYAIAIALKQGIPRVTISEEQVADDNKLQRERNRQIEKRDKVISGVEKFWGIYADKLTNQYQQFGNAGDSARNALAEYTRLSLNDKIKVIGLVLKATHAGSGRVDMSNEFPQLGLSSRFGRMDNKALDPTKLTFVYESITGLHRRKLDGKTLEQDR